MIADSTKKSITKTLLFHARGLDIPDGAAEDFIKKALAAVEKSLTKKSVITEKELTVKLVKELKRYNTDLAYVYENYDKII